MDEDQFYNNVEMALEESDDDKDLADEQKELRVIVRRLGMKEKELHDTFVLNEDKIKLLMSDQENLKLYAGDLIVFKDKADDIIGVELDNFIQFLINNTNKSKPHIKFKSLQKNANSPSHSMK